MAEYLKIPEVARRLDVSEKTARRYVKAGTLPSTFIGGAYRVTEADLEEFVHQAEVKPEATSPKASASPSQDPLFNGGREEERRASWEAAVEEARRLRSTGGHQMWRTLSEWRNSKKRGEPYATRRKYLDKIGNLLQEVYDAAVTLGHAYLQAALLTQGGSEASGPSALREESRATDQFYGRLLGLVEGFGLSVSTEGAENAGEHSAPGMERPSGVEESSDAA